MKDRREDWLAANGPCKRCGSSHNLEVDHVDPSTKVNHTVWSWRQSRMLRELQKCQVLCEECHKRKTAAENRLAQLGKPNIACRILSEDVVRRIRSSSATGRSERSLAVEFGIGKTTVHSVITRLSYGNIGA